MKRIIPWLILKLNSILANQIEITPYENKKLLTKEDLVTIRSTPNINKPNNKRNIIFVDQENLQKNYSLNIENNDQILGTTLDKENRDTKQINSASVLFGLKKQDLLRKNNLNNVSNIFNNALDDNAAHKLNGDNMDLRGLGGFSEIANNVKVTKKQLYQILKDFKTELMTKERKNNSVSKFLYDEGVLEDIENGKSINKSDLQNIIKKYQFVLEREQDNNSHKFQEKPNTPKTYEEITVAYKKYMDEASQFYNMLSYFYSNNKEMYEKITNEISSQLEDQLLEKHKILHIKYPHLKNATHFLKLNAKDMSEFQATPTQDMKHSLSKAQLGFNPKKIEPLKLTLDSPSFNSRSIKLDPINFDDKKKNRTVKSILRGSKAIATDFDFDQPIKKKEEKTPLEFEISEENKIHFNLQETRIIPKKPRREYIAKRYGISITKSDYLKLKTNNELSDAIMEFFISFLKEKQKQFTPEYMEKHDLNILVFYPSFFKELVDDNFETLNINYDKVRALTLEYSGENKTIFDRFDKILFLIKKNIFHFMLVLVICKDKKIYLYDTEKKNLKSPINNPILYNLSQYIEKEVYDKSMVYADLHRWQFMYGDVKKHDDYKESAFIIGKIIYNIYHGSWTSLFSTEEINEFREKLIKLITEIGITKDQQGELGDLTTLQL